MGNLTVAKAAFIVIGLSLLFNAHLYVLKGNKFGDIFFSYIHENMYIRIFGGFLTLFQTYSLLLASLKPISTQKIHDPFAPHLTKCFDPSKISLAPLGSGRYRLIKELEESDTFCSYLRDPPRIES
ncbi:Uncharacterized protein CTYZ_00001034 [Cryptosporidium tyzzeri]|nr:Uncharacterized protein CTYZ_00001034 [Cryptosporidium tyzzeri]